MSVCACSWALNCWFSFHLCCSYKCKSRAAMLQQLSSAQLLSRYKVPLDCPFLLSLQLLLLKCLECTKFPFSYKKKLFSDRALLTYILAILSPSILTLILMQSVDAFTVNEGILHMRSHDITYHGCSNEHTIVWFLILLMYNICLTICYWL